MAHANIHEHHRKPLNVPKRDSSPRVGAEHEAAPTLQVAHYVRRSMGHLVLYVFADDPRRQSVSVYDICELDRYQWSLGREALVSDRWNLRGIAGRGRPARPHSSTGLPNS
jgi:hypothetical protein